MQQLEVTINEQSPSLYTIKGPMVTIGSDSSNDVVIKDNFVSRKHLKILYRNGLPYVVDAGSKNGTRMNYSSMASGVESALVPDIPLQIGPNVSIRLVGKAQRPLQGTLSSRGSMRRVSRIALALDLQYAPSELDKKQMRVQVAFAAAILFFTLQYYWA